MNTLISTYNASRKPEAPVAAGSTGAGETFSPAVAGQADMDRSAPPPPGAIRNEADARGLAGPLQGKGRGGGKMFILLMTFFMLAGSASAQNLDIDLLKQINLHRPVSLDPAFLAVTHTAEPLAAAIPVTLFAAGLISKNTDLQYNALSVAGAVALSALATEGLKYAVHRPRPYETYPFIEHAGTDSDPSFPSGHTCVAFAAATSLTLAYHQWYVLVPAWTWAAAVAYSRLDLGMHYPTDVLAGAVLGAGSSWLSWKAMKWLRKKTR